MNTLKYINYYLGVKAVKNDKLRVSDLAVACCVCFASLSHSLLKTGNLFLTRISPGARNVNSFQFLTREPHFFPFGVSLVLAELFLMKFYQNLMSYST